MPQNDRPPAVPDTLTVVIMDRNPTITAIIYENEWRPYDRRSVQIHLTEEQRRQIEPRKTGYVDGRMQHEEILQCWLEPATHPLAPENGTEEPD